jgi:hypothetical protein
VLFSCLNNTFAQIPTWNWANGIHSGQDEVVTGVEVDPFTGDIYTVGYWEQNISAFFPAGVFPSQNFSSTYGNEDGFVAKYDNTGTLIWAFKIGSTEDDRVNAISVDPTGNIYITGYFSLGNNRTAKFQGTNATTGNLSSGENASDCFVAKYNSNGNLIWVRQGKSTGNRDVSGEDIAASNLGVFAVGHYNDDTDFGAFTVPDIGSFNQYFLVSYDLNGNEQWVSYGTTNNHDYNTKSYFNSVETDGTDVFITGNFKGPSFKLYDNTNTLVDTKVNSNDGRAEIVLISFSVGGNFNWMQSIGGNNHDEDHGMVLDSDSLYITGGIENNAFFPGYANNPVTSSGNMDVFLSSHSKIDGLTGWVRSITCDDGGDEMGMDLTLDGYSNILLAGYYKNALNFPGNIISSEGGVDGFIASYTSNGTFYWAKTIGSNGDDVAYGVISNSTDFAYVGGFYENAVNLDGNLMADNGRDNMFLAQIAPCKDATGGVVNTLDSDLCNGESTTITLVGSDGTIQWQSSPNGADVWTNLVGETAISFTVSPTSSTDYRAVLTPLSCDPDTSTVLTINIDPLPTATISGDATICESSTTPIDVVFTGTAPYDFTYNDGTTNTNVVANATNNYSNNLSLTDTTTYTLITVTDANGCSNIGTGSATINVIPELTINTQPSSVSTCPGSNVSFSVLAIGSDLTYKWKKDGIDIIGETNPILLLNTVAAADIASYTCVVSSSCGGPITTNNADLTLYTATNITSNPIDAHLCTGQVLNLSVSATGSNRTYQWRKDGTDIFGETMNVLTIASVTTGDVGLYTCLVTGSCNDLESNPASVQIDAPIVITTQPVSKQACPGSNISFTVAATGTNLSYQWQKSGIDIFGETSQSLILNNVVLGDEGNYRCIISSACGANLNTNIANLTIYTSTQITAEPTDVTECLGGNASFEVTALGSNLLYQWLKDGVPLADGGSITGATNSQLIISGLGVIDAGSYKCQVSGSCGFLESIAANLIVDDAIAITTQPASQVNCEGNNIVFSIVASGSNLSYQWQKNLVDIMGETNSTLNIISVTNADNGNYRCIISNSCGQTLNSDEASLSINDATVIVDQPLDAVECIGNTIIFSVTATGSSLNYQWYKDGIAMANVGDISGAFAKDLIITNLDLTDAADYDCRVIGDCGFVDSDPAVLTINDNISIATQPIDIQACASDNVSFSVFALGSGLTYQWQKDLVNIIGATNSVLALNNITAVDEASYRCIITNSCGSVLNSEIVDLTLYENTAITTHPNDATQCIGQNVSFTVVATGSNLFYQWKKDGANIFDVGNLSGSATNTLNITGIIAGDNGVYTCEVIGSCGIVNSDPANLVLKENTLITTQPSNQSVCPSANAVFNVVVSGTNLLYQWQKDGFDIVGKTNSGLIINNVAAGDAGVYRCIVTGDCGISISNGALLTVNTDLVITGQPSNDEVCENEMSGFSVIATGTGLSYQWQLNGVNLIDGGNILGASTANLTLNLVSIVDVGIYTCIVTGTCGNQTTDPATLIVNEETIITVQPQNKIACPNDNISFSVTATGTNLLYQWQKDGFDILGETNSSIILNNIAAADAAVYRCVISGDCNDLTSNGASLTINSDVAITSQPSDKEVCENDVVGFNIAAIGTGIAYQWKHNGIDLVDGANISGANTINLVIDPVALADAGAYTCEVIGTCSSLNSDAVSLIVDENIVVTTHPQNKIACPTEDVTFSVVATGANLLYQWQINSSDIVGETNSGLLLSNITALDAGVYRCVITGDCGIVNSNGGTLTVNADADITTQAIDEKVCEGQSAGFVITTLGTGLNYQWKQNGINLSDNAITSGVNTNSLSLDPVALSDAGVYTCEITATCNNINSAPVNLVVDENIVIVGHPVNITACSTENVTFSVLATGTNLSYQWQINGGDIIGETNAGLNLIAVTNADEGTYRCVITGDCGTSISNGASLIVDEKVTITSQPNPVVNICENDNLNLNIVTTGTALTYQWQKNGINLINGGNTSGATSDNLVINNIAESDDGIYTCIVTGTCATVTSNLSDVTVNPTTIVTQHPVEFIVVDGGNASFSIVAEGDNLTYKWQKDGIDIVDGGVVSGSSTTILTLTGVAESDEGAYRCVVTGTCNISNSNPANLIVNPTSNITTQPIDIVRCVGETANFSVIASGGGLTYQWKLAGTDLVDDANISGSTTSNLSINSVSLSDAGAYTCIVNTESSSPAILTVNEITIINTQPEAKTRCEGDNVILSVNASGSTLSYQWQKDGANLIDVGTLSGATTATLSISTTVLTDIGNYRCIVTGTCGTANSNPAALTVYQNTLITSQPIGNTICENESHTFSVVSDGDNLTYIWKKDGVVVVDGGNILGATTNNLVVSNAVLADAGSYTCSVSGECGLENSIIAQLFVEPITIITLQPIDASACDGDNISFSVLANGAGLNYQWQKNGANLVDGASVTGSLTPNINITGAVASDAGSYVCIISGNCGTQNSDPAELTAFENTQITTQPTGSNLCEGATVTLSVVATGGNLTYQWQKDGVDIIDAGNVSGATTANINIANALLVDAGTYSCIVSGDCGTENSNLALINVRPTTVITSQPIDKTACDGDNISFNVIADGDALTYQWQKDGVNIFDGGIISGSGTSLLSLSGISVGDAGSYRCIVTGSCGTDNSNPAILTAYKNTIITTQPLGGTICENSSITLSVFATGDNLIYQWKKGAVLLNDIGNITGSNTANININNADVSDAGTYSCEVSGSCGIENSSLASVIVEKQTQIISQPTNAGTCEGGNVSFSVLADGVNLTYQWQKDGANLVNGANITGVNTSLLQITGILATDAGSYRCVVNGNCGFKNSDPALLSAYNNTAITTQPADITICESEQISFTLVSSGDNLIYQWKKNGVDISDGGSISGANTANLIINNAIFGDAGIYTCIVTGSCGNENSTPVTATVYSNTIIATQPHSKVTCENDVVSFSVGATGESITYQWQKDGADIFDGGNIFGSTSSILTLNNLIAGDAGTYRCVVTGACSIANSDAADLTVNVYPSAAGAVIGSANVCQGSSNITYEVGAIANTDYYIWSVPVGVTILSGDSTRVIEVEFSNNELGGNITVQGLNNCGLGIVSPAFNVTANPIPVANAGADQIICIDTTYLAAAHPGTATGLWSVKDGPAWVQNVNLNSSYISNLREGTNTLIWTVEKNSCSSSDTMLIINNHVNVDAGTDVTICSDVILLEGSSVPSGATGSWSVLTGNASFGDGNDPITAVSDFATDINILKWSIAKGGCASYDTVIIDNQRPTQAYAGIDQLLCKDSTVLGANNPVVGTGEWTVITGAATFTNPTSPNTNVTNLSQGDNILRWTISNGICNTIDEVTISNNILAVNAGVDQVLCDRTTNLDAIAPITGVGNWSVIAGSAAFVNNNLNNTTVTGLMQGENILAWNINNNGCISVDSVSITNDSPTVADAGVDQTLAVDFTTLQANIPTIGDGSWSLISGSAVIVDPLLYNTNVTGLALGDNIFRWTVTNNSCTLYDDVVITNFMSVATDAGADQSVCSDETDLDGNEPIFGFGEWSVIQGSATFFDNADPKTAVSGLAKGDNILRWSVWENGWTSDDVVVTNDSPTTANAGIDQTLCSDSTLLAGNNPIVGSGLWTVISGAGTFENDTLYNTKVNNLAKGENIFKWSLSNKSCSSTDLVTIINDLPTAADAGIDQISCLNTIALNPNTPSVGAGEWSVLSGSANFSGNTAYNLAKDDNILRWTIVNNACSSYNDVTITNNEPSDANAGADKIICYDSIALAANIPLVGNGVWTVQSGSATIAAMNDPTSKVTNLSQGLNIFRWTITYNTCTKFDEVTIHNALVEATTGVDQDICSESTVLEANNPGAGSGAWSVLGGSGAAVFEDINQPDTRVSGLDQGGNILRWTITNEICISYSDVVITNSLPTDAFAGPDQELCDDNSILQANIPIVGIGEWSILSGSANLVDPNNASSLINNLDYGVNTLRWTITNGSCISADEVVISNNSTIISNAGIDQALCSDSTILYANVPTYGIGQWSVVAGSATFENNNDYNTRIRDVGKGNNILKWAISNGGCNSDDQVTITNNSPTKAIAGGDQTICGSSTYLQANIPTIGVGSWTLVSGAATFANSSQNNTQVTGLNPGSNTLRWTVENGSCTSYDDVEIYNDLPYEAQAGADFEICGNSSPLYANDPVVGIGQWDVISGKATFNDASRFDVTVSDLGFGANTLRWTISYEHCTTYDEIVVINNKIDVYAGVDQTINEPSTLLAANNPSTGSGQWTVIGGSGIFSETYNSITEVSNLGAGLNTFRWAVNINGCVSFDDVSITYNVPPTASFVVTKSEGCPPLDVYFVNNSLDDLPFTWDFDDGTNSDQVTVKHIFTEPGIYRPSLTVIDKNGEVVTKDTVINVYPQPDASFIIVNQQVYIPEEEAIFINTSTDAVTYEWRFGDGGTSTESDPKYIYDKEGIYDITLHAWSENDCYDSTKVDEGLEVIESGKITFPNAFTPNINGPNGGYYSENDYSNDVFYPIGKGIGNYKLEIFNKWGILVFESKEVNVGWDGYFDGELLKEGVYVWKVSGNYNNGKDFQEVGTVLLLR